LVVFLLFTAQTIPKSLDAFADLAGKFANTPRTKQQHNDDKYDDPFSATW
jgi:hypothetical protein